MEKELTKEERIIELLEMLSSQDMQEKMENFFQFCAYVDDLEKEKQCNFQKHRARGHS